MPKLLLQKVSRLLSRIMKLNILVCTTVKRIADVAGLLLPQRCDVSYIVSVQYDGEALPSVSVPELKREDVAVHFLRGFGLCRNRNNRDNDSYNYLLCSSCFHNSFSS